MKMTKENLVFNGSVAKALARGATIVWHRWNTYNWFVLVQNPKGSEWRFEYHQTSNRHHADSPELSTFSLMVTYKHTKAQSIKLIEKEFYEEWGHYDRQVEKAKEKAAQAALEAAKPKPVVKFYLVADLRRYDGPSDSSGDYYSIDYWSNQARYDTLAEAQHFIEHALQSSPEKTFRIEEVYSTSKNNW